MAWCPNCCADRALARRKLTEACPYCGCKPAAAHRAGCRGSTAGAIDTCTTCKMDLFPTALTLSGFEFMRENERRLAARRALRRRLLIVAVVAGLAGGGAWLATRGPGPAQPDPPPPSTQPGPSATQAPAPETTSAPPAPPAPDPLERVAAAARALLEDAGQRDAIGKLAVAALRPTASFTSSTLSGVRRDGEAVVAELDLAWADRASGAKGATRVQWRCSAQAHLEARATEKDAPVPDAQRRKLDNLFRTSVWPKLEAALKVPAR